MAYWGAEASRDVYEQLVPVAEPTSAPSLEVIEGGGRDARARRAVSASFVRTVRIALVAVVLAVAVGGLRVALSCVTLEHLQHVGELRSEVSSLEDMNADLEIERSLEASSQRIVGIATETYGMVLATDVEQIAVAYADATDETQDASAEQALAQDAAEAVEQQGEESSLQDATPVVAAVGTPSEDGR
jgi:cell division protein FtsL